MKSSLNMAALIAMVALLQGCAVYGPPPATYSTGSYYQAAPVYDYPAPSVYYYPAPFYVAPPVVSFRFNFGYWSGGHGGYGGWGHGRRW
ncbi:hypothetical protein EGT07_15820 [Herbaspirillum sp. HC18]|nr:hypothetical protein EGT07_15820 [Herbaspirillum sp. HC18]